MRRLVQRIPGLAGSDRPLPTDPVEVRTLLEDERFLDTVGQLAREYGFTDVDGRQWPPFQIEA